jgi:excisionase family DNA binding protein
MDIAMARQRREQDYTALFVRIPTTEAEKLHKAADVLRTPKRELITRLVERFDPHDPVWTQEVAGPPMPAAAEWEVGRASFRPTEVSEVLTPAQLAELLQADEEAVVELAERGEIPARKVGSEWRFSRSAILAWLGEEPEE